MNHVYYKEYYNYWGNEIPIMVMRICPYMVQYGPDKGDII